MVLLSWSCCCGLIVVAIVIVAVVSIIISIAFCCHCCHQLTLPLLSPLSLSPVFVMAAQQWWRSYGRSNGREGGGAAMAMAVQQWQWRRSNSGGGAEMA
jgi:hypothetical protein